MIGPDLIDLIATETLWPRTDVAMRYRYLTAAGMLPKGGRGRNAPHLDSRHAAALLVAVLADAPQSGAAEAVRAIDGAGRGTLHLADGTVVAEGSFLDVVAQIIDSYRSPNPATVAAAERVANITVCTAAGVSRGKALILLPSGGGIETTFGTDSAPIHPGNLTIRRVTGAPQALLRKIAHAMGATTERRTA